MHYGGSVFCSTPNRATSCAYLREDTVVVNVAKGLEDGSYKRLSQVLEEELPGRRVVVMSGPSHAEEVGRARRRRLPLHPESGRRQKKFRTF